MTPTLSMQRAMVVKAYQTVARGRHDPELLGNLIGTRAV